MTAKRQPTPSTVTVHVPLTFTVRGGRKTIIGELPYATPRAASTTPSPWPSGSSLAIPHRKRHLRLDHRARQGQWGQ